MLGPISAAFVDSISPDPGVRLPLNGEASLHIGEGFGFPPPPLRRAEATTMLADGTRYPAWAYSNRSLTLPVLLTADDSTQMQAAARALHRELTRTRNWLRVSFGTGPPFFFQTHLAPDYELEVFEGQSVDRYELTIPADPFAIGLREDLPTVTVPNDPAAPNGCQFDVRDVKGDVDTPALIRLATTAGPTTGEVVLASRRRNVIGVRYVVQAEAGTVLVGAINANDPVMSGPGPNYFQTTFTNSAHIDRLQLPWPPAAGAGDREYAGTFRVHARVRKTVSTDTITLSLGVSGLHGERTVLPTGNGPMFIDLGLVTVGGVAPDLVGFSSRNTSPGDPVVLAAGRAAGTGALDVDYVAFVPADDQFTTVGWSGLAGSARKHLDGPQDRTYAGSGDLLTDPAARVVGQTIRRTSGLPRLSPGLVNRFVLHNRRSLTSDVLTDSTDVSVSYWPFHLTPA